MSKNGFVWKDGDNRLLFQLAPRSRAFFEDIGRRDCVRIEKMPMTGEYVPMLDRVAAGPHADYLQRILQNRSSLLEMYTTLRVLMEGPKVLKLAQLDAEALEHTDLNVAFGDYEQPFPTMVIHLPKDYFRDRMVHCEQAGEVHIEYASTIKYFPEQHHPVDITLHYNEGIGLLISSIYFSSRQSLNFSFAPKNKELTLTDLCTIGFKHDKIFEETRVDQDTNEDELGICMLTTRIALNAMLALSQGAKRVGPLEPEKDAELKRYVRAAEANQRRHKKVDENKLAEARDELKHMPVVYSFDQHVELYDCVKGDATGEGPSGWKLGPHWRQGHHQHYWVGHGPDKKRERRKKKPQFVNYHLYKGAMADAKVTYTFK